jgi:hypothetical protein
MRDFCSGAYTLVLKELYAAFGASTLSPNPRDFLIQRLNVRSEEIVLSGINLFALRCANNGDIADTGFVLTIYGRELVRACSD